MNVSVEKNMEKSLFAISGIFKEFSGVRVLDNINLDIRSGEILGILGENGAGKSTLLKIISGIYTPTSGDLLLNGEKVDIPSPMEAKKLGISMIPQEFNLVDTLTVFENIFLGSELCSGLLLNKQKMRERTTELLLELQTTISPNALISSLSVAQKQMVEIAKALVHDSSILIMDEPTTVLTNTEVEILLRLMEKLKDKGVTILFISHKLKEVKRVCDRVLILRDGEQISVEDVNEIDVHDMARKMVGRELNTIFPEKAKASTETVLKVSNLNIPKLLHKISFHLNKGEILGLSGLVGAGRTELAESIMGLRQIESGEIEINDKVVSINSPLDALNHKLGYLSEDRKGKGLLLNFRIPENISLISLKKYTNIFINKSKEAESAKRYVKQFNIKASSMKSELEYLSGGNQQKVYFSKWMDTEPEILILDEPTRGIDVNAKKEIYHFIRSLVDNGVSCIVISSELEEVIGLCSRVLVMREGSITGEVTGSSINEEEIMFYAAGLK